MEKKLKYFVKLLVFISFCLSTKVNASEFDLSFKKISSCQKNDLAKKKFLSLKPVLSGGFLRSFLFYLFFLSQFNFILASNSC